jgi:hypothetical protein
MRKYPGMPELLEQLMKEEGPDERWVTIQELRDRFGLTRYQCNTVSGFLHRLQHGNFAQFPFIVLKREWAPTPRISDTRVYRYLVKRRDIGAAALQDLVFL